MSLSPPPPPPAATAAAATLPKARPTSSALGTRTARRTIARLRNQREKQRGLLLPRLLRPRCCPWPGSTRTSPVLKGCNGLIGKQIVRWHVKISGAKLRRILRRNKDTATICVRDNNALLVGAFHRKHRRTSKLQKKNKHVATIIYVYQTTCASLSKENTGGRTSKQAKQASKQVSKQASEQASKQVTTKEKLTGLSKCPPARRGGSESPAGEMETTKPCTSPGASSSGRGGFATQEAENTLEKLPVAGAPPPPRPPAPAIGGCSIEPSNPCS